MRFYTEQHRYYCGIDLHARSMYVCVLNGKGEKVAHTVGQFLSRNPNGVR